MVDLGRKTKGAFKANARLINLPKKVQANSRGKMKV